jgi:hypothetical protein
VPIIAPVQAQAQAQVQSQAQAQAQSQAQAQAQSPIQAPVQAPIQAPVQAHSALASIIVNALKLASPEPVTSTEQVPITSTEQVPVTSTEPAPVTSTEPAPVTSTEPALASNVDVQSSDSPGFIALIQKYLEPIIGQFSPTENKPQKVFDIEQLPRDMQRILEDSNIKYIGRYRTDANPGKNELSTTAQPQTTYLFWNTSTQDYISHTVADVNVKSGLKVKPGFKVNVVSKPSLNVKAEKTKQYKRTQMPPAPPFKKTSKRAVTPNALPQPPVILTQEEEEEEEEEAENLAYNLPQQPTYTPVINAQGNRNRIIPLGGMI